MLWAHLCHAELPLGQINQYTIQYNGFASAYTDWVVADAQIEIAEQPVDFAGVPAYAIEASVSSANYALPESLFKTRYCYKSLLNLSLTRTLLAEEKNEGRRLKHKILWFDWGKGVVEGFKVRRKKKPDDGWFTAEQWIVSANESIPAWLMQQYPEPAPGVPYFESAGKGLVTIGDPMYDLLSAMLLFRQKPLAVGQHYDLPVTSEEKTFWYSLTVEKATTLEYQGKTVPVFEISVDTSHLPGVFEKSEQSRLTVWVGQAEGHLPYRYEAEVLYGHFTVTLK